jgi:hypothetical protein
VWVFQWKLCTELRLCQNCGFKEATSKASSLYHRRGNERRRERRQDGRRERGMKGREEKAGEEGGVSEEDTSLLPSHLLSSSNFTPPFPFTIHHPLLLPSHFTS